MVDFEVSTVSIAYKSMIILKKYIWYVSLRPKMSDWFIVKLQFCNDRPINRCYKNVV